MGTPWLSCDHNQEFVPCGNKQPSLNMMENMLLDPHLPCHLTIHGCHMTTQVNSRLILTSCFLLFLHFFFWPSRYTCDDSADVDRLYVIMLSLFLEEKWLLHYLMWFRSLALRWNSFWLFVILSTGLTLIVFTVWEHDSTGWWPDKQKRPLCDYVPNCPWAVWPLTLDASLSQLCIWLSL